VRLLKDAEEFALRAMRSSINFDKKDLLLLLINETFGLVIAFQQKFGLGGILYNAPRSAVASGQILETGIIL
jgi:hypothetical protein